MHSNVPMRVCSRGPWRVTAPTTIYGPPTDAWPSRGQIRLPVTPKIYGSPNDVLPPHEETTSQPEYYGPHFVEPEPSESTRTSDATSYHNGYMQPPVVSPLVTHQSSDTNVHQQWGCIVTYSSPPRLNIIRHVDMNGRQHDTEMIGYDMVTLQVETGPPSHFVEGTPQSPAPPPQPQIFRPWSPENPGRPNMVVHTSVSAQFVPMYPSGYHDYHYYQPEMYSWPRYSQM